MITTWGKWIFGNIAAAQWQRASLLHRCVGLFHQWRQSSWLMQSAEAWGALLIALVLCLGPFVSTGLIGLLLVAVIGYWTLLTLTDELGQTSPGQSNNAGMDLPKRSLSLSPIHLFVALYWGIATLATAFSPAKTAAFAGWVKLSLYLGLFLLAARILRSPRLKDWLIGLYLHIATIVSIYGVRQQFFGADQLATWNDPNSPLAQDTRVYSYLGNPNLLAGYLLVAVALSFAALFVWQRWSAKLLAGLMYVLNVACLFFTDSRGGWLGLVATGATFLLLLYLWYRDRLPTFWRRWLIPMALGISALGIAFAMTQVESIYLRVSSIFAGREDSSNNFRINVWMAVIDMIRDYPWLGIGPGNQAFNQIYPLYMTPNYTALSAYSIYLETAVEMGFIGLGVFIWLITVTISQGVQQLLRFRQHGNIQGLWTLAAIAAIVGLLTHGIVDTVWYRPQINILWWFMVALVASTPLPEPQTSSQQPM